MLRSQLLKSTVVNSARLCKPAQTQALRAFSSKDIREYPRPLKTKKNGIDILHDPLWNKSLAFDHSERDRLGIRGLLPPTIRSEKSQVERVIGHIRKLPDDISKNLYLQDLHNRNETLFHHILINYIDEIAPLVYTPTVGTVCQQFGYRFTRPRGMYFSKHDRGQFSTMVYNWPHDDVHVVVVTDGSRVLGLGDLGVHGMGISIGKLALYCAAGGIAPHRVLPIALDVGTNNEHLLQSPDYVGIQEKRLTGDEYYDMIDEFMAAIFARWPDVVVQFEDFETSKAVPLLAKYRDRYRCFNDDIQGTGAVTFAGILSTCRIAQKPLKDMRFLCAGAGAAGLGVCQQIVDGLVLHAGLTIEEARSRFVVASVHGALGRCDGVHENPHYNKSTSSDGNSAPLSPLSLETVDLWANDAVSDGTSLLDVIKEFKPTVLLGLTATPHVFTEEMLKEMTKYCERPVIMPMSNPTNRAECTAEQAYTWTQGKAIVATGSPFAPVTLPDGRVFHPSQCNNMYIFPGIGLAASVAGIRSITDKMLYEASLACANATNEQDIEEGRTFPHVKRIREVSLKVACAVIREGLKSGLCTKIRDVHLREGSIEQLVAKKMYYPQYVPLL